MLEEVIGDRTFRARSIENLPRLESIVYWAKRARVVRVAKGTMHGTTTFRNLARDPVAAVDRLVDALFDVGPLLMQRRRVAPADELSTLYTDAAIVGMLASQYATNEPLDFEQLVARMVDLAAAREPDSPYRNSELLEWVQRRQLALAFRALEQVAVVRHAGASLRPERYGPPTVTGGTITLTAFGVATVQRLAGAWGFEAPVSEPFTASASDDVVVVLRALRTQLDTAGPSGLVEAFDSLGMTGFIDSAWRTDSDDALAVLEALGHHHLDKATARAARKAVIQHRSWLANRS
jgi:hypothetical protein